MRWLALFTLPLMSATAGCSSAAETKSVAPTTNAKRTLAYLESVAGETPDPITDIFVVNADGSGRRRVTRSRRFVFDTNPYRSGGNSIWVMGRDGSRRRRLTQSESWKKKWVEPSWSDRIAFERVVHPQAPLAFDRPELYVMNADGSGQRRLYSSTKHGDEFALSPDWRKLALLRQGPYGPPFDLYVMNIDGTGRRRLVRSTSNGERPSGSPPRMGRASVGSCPRAVTRSGHLTAA